MRRTTAAVLLLGAFVAGCATDTETPYLRDGKTYGVTRGVFRGRWWSYYERGSSFLNGEFHAEAAADFEQALSGRSRDSWRARTYGLHFVEYFPNRELGITYYHMDRLEEAETYLTRSLEQIDTDRAHYYLDLVKKQQIAQGVIQDTQEPALDTSLAPAVIISVRELPLEIEARDDNGVAAVAVNGEELHQRGSAEEVTFKQEVVLNEGVHEIAVEATDLAEKKTVETVAVTVDLTGPTIGIFSPIEPTVTEKATVYLEGATVDKNGVISVAVDRRVLAESAGASRLPFDTELPLGDGENTFILAARDVAGNETRSAVKVFKGDPDSAEAKLWLLQQQHPERMKLAHAGGLAVDLLLSVTPEEGGEIRLKSPAPDRPYRHNRTLRVAGEVVTPTKVASLTINGEPFSELTGAPKESFNRRIPIDAAELGEGGGRMAIAIRAEDEGGAVVDKSFEVEVRPVDLASLESRMPVAVLAFAGHEVEPAVTESLRLSTETQLFQQGRFRVLDRTRLQDVLTELELVAADLTDPDQAISVGLLTPTHVFLVADVFAHEQNGLEVKARVIRTETSDVVATLDVFIDDRNNPDTVAQACDALAAQLAQTYPRLSGEVLGVRERPEGVELLVNWTREDGIKEGAYLLVVHEEEPWIDESTGEVLEPGELVKVGRARILSILSNGSKARTVETEATGPPIKTGMPAVSM